MSYLDDSKYENCGILTDLDAASNNLKDCQNRINMLLKESVKSDKGLDSMKQMELETELEIMKDEMMNTKVKATHVLETVNAVKQNKQSVKLMKDELNSILEGAKNIEGMEDILKDFPI
jgi:hypothetical protein